MDQPTSAPAGTLRGIVFAFPSRRRVAGALVRFFEMRDDKAKATFAKPSSITDHGVPVGSVLTDEGGEFSLQYAAPKGAVGLAFVVQGPDMGGSCDFLSWSSSTRRINTTGEAFLIGVDERMVARRRLEHEAKSVKRLHEQERVRKAALESPTPAETKKRLGNLQWITAGQTLGRGAPAVHVDPETDSVTVAKLNADLLSRAPQKDTSKTRGRLRRTGVPRIERGKPRKAVLAVNRGRLGLPAENRFATISKVLDRLSPELRQMDQPTKMRVELGRLSKIASKGKTGKKRGER